jgi:hypothetical protein
MKKRINISIEYGILIEAQKTINNMSRFLEKCLQNYLIYSKDKKPKNIIYEDLTEEEKKTMKNNIEIANVKWWED